MQDGEKTLYLHLTEKCNLNCKHCYLGSKNKRTKSLSWPQIKNALVYFFQKGFLALEVTGGEPSLSPFFKKTIYLAKKIGYSPIGISSNGTLKKMIDQFSPKDIQRFVFGFDGPTPKIDGILRGKEHLEKCLVSIAKARSKGFEVFATQCIHTKNLNKIEKTIKLLEKYGVARLSLNYISRMGNAKNNQRILPTPRQWINLRKKIVGTPKISKSLSLRLPLRFVSQTEYQKILKEGYSCPLATPQQAIVFPGGEIFYCCLLTESSFLTGGKVIGKGVIIKRNDLALLKKYPASPCPAHEILFAEDKVNRILPVCVYKKIIIKPSS